MDSRDDMNTVSQYKFGAGKAVAVAEDAAGEDAAGALLVTKVAKGAPRDAATSLGDLVTLARAGSEAGACERLGQRQIAVIGEVRKAGIPFWLSAFGLGLPCAL